MPQENQGIVNLPGNPDTMISDAPSQHNWDGGKSNGGLSDDASLAKLAMQVIYQSTKQTDMSGAVQSRPQVILPQPRVAPQMTTNSQPTGQVQATTRAGQRRNDMGNLISSVGNVVKAGVNKKRQNDERDLMHDLAVIQAASSNPDDPHNRVILDKMMNDPKVTKRLQKALGYNPLSGDAPPPEAQTLMKFGAQLQQKQQVQQNGQGGQPVNRIQNNPALGGGQGQPQPNGQPQGNVQPQGQPKTGAMENLMSRQPNTQQINPVVSMQAELIKAGILPKNDMSPKALLTFIQEAMKDSTKREEIKRRAETSGNAQLMKLYETLVKADSYLTQHREHNASQEKQTHERTEATKYSADQHRIASENRAGGRDQDMKNMQIAAKAYDEDIKNLQVDEATALKVGDKKKAADIGAKIQQKQAIKNSIEKLMNQKVGAEEPKGGVDELEQSDSPSQDDMDFGDKIFGADDDKNN